MRSMRPLHGFARTIASSLCLASLAIASTTTLAHAAPTDPVSVTLPPTGEGPPFVPGVRELTPLRSSYVEQEYFVSGAADLFNYAHNPPLGPTDIEVIDEDVPYKTRIIVRRPVSASTFNGTVVIDWWNSTAGFDTAPGWDTSADYFLREGYIYVGVTNSTTSLGFLTGGCRLLGLLPPVCGTRYSTLSLPENGVAFEMVSQIAHLLKSDSPENPLPPEFEVERLYHTGQSQQGGSMVTYASAFHFADNDGYFIQQAATARSINFGTSCDAAGAPAFPDCTPRLQGADRLVRTDLPVPVYHVVSETDIDILFGTAGRQADTPTFRYFEVAGASHLTVHEDIEFIPAGVLGPNALYLEDFCNADINSTADGPVFFGYVLNALWDAMENQVQNGDAPPAGILMDVDPGTDLVNRDADGNGLGGVRLPSMEVPVATYTPGNSADPSLPPLLRGIGNLACRLAGSVTPFDAAKMDALYPNHGTYVSQVVHASNALRDQGLLLNADRRKLVRAASQSTIGCGLGFEVALIVPALMWARRRRRRRA